MTPVPTLEDRTRDLTCGCRYDSLSGIIVHFCPAHEKEQRRKLKNLK